MEIIIDHVEPIGFDFSRVYIPSLSCVQAHIWFTCARGEEQSDPVG